MHITAWLKPKEFLKNTTITQISIVTAFSVAIVAIVTFSFLNLTFLAAEGTTAPRTIVSPFSKTFQTEADNLETERLRGERAGLVKDVFVTDKNVIEEVNTAVISFFTNIRKLKLEELKAEDIAAQGKIPAEISSLLANEKSESLSLMESFVLNAVEKIMNEGVVSVDDETVIKKLENILRQLKLRNDAKAAIREVILRFIKTNKVYDTQITEQARLQARETVQPIKTWVREGQVIVYKGDNISREQIEILKKLNLYGLKVDVLTLISIIIVCLLLFWSCLFGVFLLKKELIRDNGKLILLSTIFIVITILARLLEPVSDYLVPVPMAALLISVLMGPLVSLIAIAHLSILAGVLFHLDFSVFLVLFCSSIISIYTVRNATQRTTITKTGLEISLVNVVLITLLGLIKHEAMSLIALNCFWGIINGIGSSILSQGLLPLLENMFKIVTTMRLVELANPGHPLLKKLMVEAPGTYQHSLMVANLAEAATEAIHGNGLLCRVACYYHDIGKLRRPSFFIENQRWSGNPHDKLDPKLSALIITAHPKDGVALLKEYKMPEFLYDSTMQHHGTGLVAYFYRQMISQKEENFDEEQFRYEGPCPQAKETAVLMLADAVEAAVRTLEKPSPTKLENIISKLIKEKFDDGQLEEAPLTMHDITMIKNTFINVLSNALHKRIEYPENEQVDQGK
ncbi:HD family phosphohydrolase [Candidatus Margulisiibacteriota bacterium]